MGLLPRRACVSLPSPEALTIIRDAHGSIRLAGAVLAGLLLGPASARAADNAAEGYLVVTLGTSNANFPLSLDYASSDHRISEEVEWTPATPNDLGTDRGEQGVIHVKALPPGRYLFYRVAVNDGSFIHRWAVSLPFTIAANQVTYAGDFTFILHQDRNILDRPMAGGGYFRVSDQSIRDIPVAARKALEPGLTDMHADTSPVAAAGLDAPPFCLPPASSAAPSDGAPICKAP